MAYDNSPVLYIDPNKNRTQNWLQLTRLQLPFVPDQYGFIDKVTLGKKMSRKTESSGTVLLACISEAVRRPPPKNLSPVPQQHQHEAVHYAGGQAEDQHRSGDGNIFTIVPVMSPSA